LGRTTFGVQENVPKLREGVLERKQKEVIGFIEGERYKSKTLREGRRRWSKRLNNIIKGSMGGGKYNGRGPPKKKGGGVTINWERFFLPRRSASKGETAFR